MCEKFSKLEFNRARPKISPHAKNQPWGLPVSSINSVHIKIYIQLKSGLLPPRIILPPCMPLFLHNTIYKENILCFLRIGVFCYLYHAKMYNLNVFSIGLFCPLNYLLYNVGSGAKSPLFWTEKENCLYFR